MKYRKLVSLAAAAGIISSVFAVSPVFASSSENVEELLGGAVNFGITAETFDQRADAQTNIAVQEYNGNGHYIGADIVNGNPGVMLIGEIKGDDIKLKVDTEVYEDVDDEVIEGLIEDAVKNIEEEIKSQEIIDLPKHNDNGFDQNNYVVDVREIEDDIVAVEMNGRTLSSIQSGGMKIFTREDQTVIIRVDYDDDIDLREYYINGQSSATHAQNDDLSSKVVWLFKDAEEVRLAAGVSGAIVAPDADVIINSTGSGWIIAEDVTNPGGEWHMVYPAETPGASTATPTIEPTAEPTVAPTAEPTVAPTAEPTEEPANPTEEPTAAPTEEPANPTEEPTVEPTSEPAEPEDNIPPRGDFIDATEFRYAYIYGYEPYDDGMGGLILEMGPHNSVTREEVATMVTRIVDSVNGSADIRQATPSAFGDIEPGRWSYRALSYLTAQGAFEGQSSLSAAAPVTRGEAAKMIALGFNVPETDEDSGFSDIEGNPYQVYIERLAAAGFVNGDGSGSYYPESYMTRAEYCSMFNNILGRGADFVFDPYTDFVNYQDETPTEDAAVEVTMEYYGFTDTEVYAEWEIPVLLKATSAFDEMDGGFVIDIQTRKDTVRNKMDQYDGQTAV